LNSPWKGTTLVVPQSPKNRAGLWPLRDGPFRPICYRGPRTLDRHRTLFVVYRLPALLLLAPLLILWKNPVPSVNPAFAQLATGNGVAVPTLTGQALVDRALANELNAAQNANANSDANQNASHPLRYQLRKTSPRLTTTKEILETEDGEVARLIAVNDQPLSAVDEANEEARLKELLGDPAKQRRRKQAEEEDADRAINVLRALPSAFLYQDAGPGEGPTGKIEKFTFRPNPKFSPLYLETEVLPAMTGEIWIDPVNLRVARLEAHLQQDVDFGWGILGRLNKGGWIVIEQADVGSDMGPDKGPGTGIAEWRTVRFQMQMSGRVVFKARVFDTTEVQSNYAPLPTGTTYQKAIQTLLSGK
jgi:hypothetical protein